MKELEIKVILMAIETAAIVAVIILALSTSAEQAMGHWFRGAYIVGFSLLAIVMQGEQQQIPWESEE